MLGTLLGIGGSLLGGFLNNEAADDRQKDAQSFNSAQFASRYQTTMKDMEAAGLNPGLAYGGISGSPSPAGIAGSAGFGDIGGAATQGMRTDSQVKLQSAQMANVEADTANKAAQGRLYDAQAAAATGSAWQSNATVNVLNETVNKIRHEIPLLTQQTLNAEQQRDVLRESAAMLRAQEQLMLAQGKTQSDVQAQLKALAQKLVADTSLANLDIQAAQQFENFGREAGQLKPFFDILRMFIRR